MKVDRFSKIMQDQIESERIELKRRQEVYRKGRVQPNLSDRTVVIVDEGLSTGATMTAAVMTIRKLAMNVNIIIAIPVASQKNLQRFMDLTKVSESDICVLKIPDPAGKIWSTTDFYNKEKYRKATDEDVIEILSDNKKLSDL